MIYIINNNTNKVRTVEEYNFEVRNGELGDRNRAES